MHGRRCNALIENLGEWFDQQGRDLPWRRKRTPYTALVAEAMLQQTQVQRVLEYYNRFIRRFPSLKALADANEQEVLAAWQGLGYYRRARNLHAAAKQIRKCHGGRVPRRVDQLIKLPGVGRYTAGALTSIVFNLAEPVVDGNVKRVLTRWQCTSHREAKKVREADIWQWAKELVEQAPQPGKLNEAMMELGATICKPRSPACDRCPVSAWCNAFQTGKPQQINFANKRISQKSVHHHSVIFTRSGQVLLEQRSSDGLWANMWQVPTIESSCELEPARFVAEIPCCMGTPNKCGSFVHQTTHRKITFHVYHGKTRQRRGQWRELTKIDGLPISNAMRKVLQFA